MTNENPNTDILDASPGRQIVHLLNAAEFHWHFYEGIKVLRNGHYIAGTLSLLAGIEASIRFTLTQLKSNAFPFVEDLGSVLSNSLILQAHEKGMPVQLLAEKNENDFINKLNSRKPEVWLVELRNNLAHGNIQKYVNREPGDDYAFFTPECLRGVAQEVERISFEWAKGLSAFRQAKSL